MKFKNLFTFFVLTGSISAPSTVQAADPNLVNQCLMLAMLTSGAKIIKCTDLNYSDLERSNKDARKFAFHAVPKEAYKNRRGISFKERSKEKRLPRLCGQKKT